MATWIAHLRTAERVLKRGYAFPIKPFLIGNIAPDAGLPNDTWTEFDPPAAITHWLDEDDQPNPRAFYDAHLADFDPDSDLDQFAFLVGYYFHLIADQSWARFLDKDQGKDPLYKNIMENPDLIREVKRDWYGQDFLYLRENPDCIFFTEFVNLQDAPQYLDYLPPEALMGRIQYIIDWYTTTEVDLDRPFPHFPQTQMDAYVDRISQYFMKEMVNRDFWIIQQT